MGYKKKFSDSISNILGRIGRLRIFTPIAESIRNKLLFWFIMLAIIPLFLLGWITNRGSSKALGEKAFNSLKAVESIKSATIETYFKNRRYDMNVLVETVKTLRHKALNQLTSVQYLKKELIENYFSERMSDVSVVSKIPTMAEAMIAFEKAGAIGSSEWRAAEQTHGPFLVSFTENYGYYDTFLVSTDGMIRYTAAQEADLGQNLETGELRDSPAGEVFRKGLEGLAFQDFGEYEPAGNVPAAFISAPIKDREGQTLGVFIMQVSIDQINAIMQERTGLGQTGGTYLVGADRLFRSDSIHVRESTVMNPAFVVDTEGVSESLAGRTGQGVLIDYRGEYAVSSWIPVNVHDVRWAMMAEIDVTEAFVPKRKDEEKDFFTKYKEGYGYDDLCLVNPDGYLFFSVEKGKDYQTNMLTGPYKDSNLGRLIKKVLETKTFGMADFEKYAPGNNEPAAFFAQPVLSEERVELVVVTKLSLEQINAIMQDRIGLGDSGETYLVGQDGLWRSDSHFLKKTAVLNPDIKTKLPAPKGTQVIEENYRGQEVLSSWSPLMIMEPDKEGESGITWTLVADIGYKEVNRPVVAMAWFSLMTIVIVGGVVLVVSMLLARSLTTQVNHITDLFGEIGIGNFKARTPVVSQDELGTMASSLNAVLDNTLSLIQSSEERDAMQSSVMKLLTEISELAEGDLTKRAEVTEDFTGAIADSFNDMAEQIGGVVRNVKNVTHQVSATSREVSESTEKLAETSEMQAVQVSDAIAAISEMAASIQQVAENAGECTRVSEESTQHAKKGAEAVQDTNSAMESIREHVQETARAIKRLGESSQEIGNIVQLINDIADRTSILALNASIQAAMAGDAGRGFAVVAEEVQRLAERSTNSTKQIDTLIKNIQGEIAEAGTSMEESIQRVVEGSKLADGTHDKLQEIENVALRLGDIVQSISMASKQQARASENIANTMEEVGEISSQTSAASRQTAIAMKSLSQMSDQLNNSVAVFRVNEDGEEEED